MIETVFVTGGSSTLGRTRPAQVDFALPCARSSAPAQG